MAVTIGLWCVAVLFAVSLLTLVRGPFGTAFVYGATLVISLMALALGLTELIGARVSTVALPLGLPILDGAHFRIDALTAFFLTVVNLGGATTSLYAIGYGRHEEAPMRVLPFYPAFRPAMNLALLADHPFLFLLSCHLISLASPPILLAPPPHP